MEEIRKEINYSSTHEEIIHNCNIDLRTLGYEESIELDSYLEQEQFLDKYDNSINMEFDLYDEIVEKIEYYKRIYEEFPFIKHSIEEYLLDYLEDAITAYKENNWRIYYQIKERIKSFNAENCFIEIIGKRIGFCQYIDTLNLELDNYKEELEKLNYQDIISQIEKEASDKKYYEYGKRQYHHLQDDDKKEKNA